MNRRLNSPARAPVSGAGIPAFDDCLSIDRPRLQRLAAELRRSRDERKAKLQADLDALCARSRTALAQRVASLPRPDFPAELPVSGRREEIAAALVANQVIIVCGETGSGKTTQLPKICLSLGRGAAGLIGHTQPRRLAARATATRIAHELNSPLGEAVGYKIRFSDKLSAASHIKLMTDGILLAETQTDPLLAAYDTIIIDEAHERSLNIDFLLGYLRTLLPRRPDLKVIVTSATLDAERFARHFADAAGQPAPVIEVSGRLYPIEMRYRPVDSDDAPPPRAGERAAPRRDKGRDLLDAIVDAIDEAQRSGPGDVLVFLPGEREIREAAEALRKAQHLPGTEILPLFARQSAQDQARVFSASGGRRVVLSTNVAETSLTVPGIRYVVDTGLARLKRYSPRTKVEQLQIEKIAQSAAQQRAGRCGRVMDGVCFRLYDEDDFSARPAHTDPEILRSSLAGVILRMKSLRLGAVEDFPFIDAPGSRLIGDGYALLAELGAVTDDDARTLTPTGHELAKLPLDPRIGRMILAARARGSLAEVLVIAAALSVQDPRDRPQESAGSADQAHARFRGGEQDQRSEFVWYLHLWKAWDELQRHESSSKQKAWCKQHFLSYMRMREWRDVFTQLHALCAEHGWKENQLPANYEAIHKALLAGLLGSIGCKVEDASGPQAGSYLGARGIKFWPHPGSALAKKAGKWIMCAEQVETSRLFGRCIARIEPEWVEEVGAHLLRRQVFEPHWSKSSGAVRAWERGTLYGLVLYPRRGVGYRDTDPQLCRELFIRDGLVGGEISEAAARAMPFLTHNRRLVAEIERLEHKSRRPDVLVDETLIEAFYDSRIPPEVVDVAGLEAWRKTAEKAEPTLLHLTREQLMRHEAEGITTERFPARFTVLGQVLGLSYLHQPGDADDGVTLTVPLAMLNQIPVSRCEWLVPGLLEEKVAALLKTVPQKHRHRLQPVGESAAAFMAAFEAGTFATDEPLLKAVQSFVEDRVQLKLALESFRPENLKPHCFMNFRVVDEHGRVMGQSRNLAELRTRFRDQVAARFSAAKIGGALAGALDGAGVAPASAAGGKKLGGEKAGGEQAGPAKAANTASALAQRNGDGATDQGTGAGAALSGLTGWSFGALPELLEIRVAGRDVIGFPALHDDGDSVSLRPYDTPEEAARVHRRGLARLFALTLKDQVRAVERLPGLRELALQYLSFGTEAELKAQLVEATLSRCCLLDPLPADKDAFERRCMEAKSRVSLVAQEFMRLAGQLLTEHAALNKRLVGLKAFPEVVADLQAQVAGLLPKDFLVAFAWDHLAQFPRYLKAASIRLDKLRNNPARDAQSMSEWKALAQVWEREMLAKRRAGVVDAQLDAFRWLLEELRVGLFAQELKTPMPVSVKRLQKIWESRPR